MAETKFKRKTSNWAQNQCGETLSGTKRSLKALQSSKDEHRGPIVDVTLNRCAALGCISVGAVLDRAQTFSSTHILLSSAELLTYFCVTQRLIMHIHPKRPGFREGSRLNHI